jgi:hypothetical protein
MLQGTSNLLKRGSKNLPYGLRSLQRESWRLFYFICLFGEETNKACQWPDGKFKTERPDIRFCYSKHFNHNIIFYTSIWCKFASPIIPKDPQLVKIQIKQIMIIDSPLAL